MSSTEQTQEKGEEALTDCLCLSVGKNRLVVSQCSEIRLVSAEQTPLKQTDREEEEEEGALTDWLCLFVCQKEQAGGQSVS